MMDTRGARILVTDMQSGRIFEEYVDPNETSMGLPGMAQAVRAMKETLPPITRRTPRQKMESFIERVIPDMLQMYRIEGRAVWPRSVQKVLHYLSERDHDPSLLNEYGGVEGVIHQGKALLRWVIEAGENQQKEQDYKKVTLDWAGH